MERFVYIILCFALFTTAGSLQAQDESSLEWGTPITAGDFLAPPNEQDTAAASISVTIVLGYFSNLQGQLKFRIVAVMDKAESWIKEEFKNDHEILLHEQGHFDIAHIYAQRLNTHLRQKKFSQNDVAALQRIYDNFLGRMHVLQIRYDEETNGGINSEAQQKWRKMIDDELSSVE